MGEGGPFPVGDSQSMIGVSDLSDVQYLSSYLLLYTARRRAGCLLLGCSMLLVVAGGLVALPVIGFLAGGSGDLGVAIVLVLCGLLLGCGMAAGIVHLSRPPSAWLEGTTVVVRRFLFTRRCDLATATSVMIDSVPETRSVSYGDGLSGSAPTRRMIPALWTQLSHGDHNLRVCLRHPKTCRLLEPAKLHALADAMLAGPRGPDPATQQWVDRIAQGLHEMTDDPFAGMR